MKIVYCLPQFYCPGGIERIVSIKANYLAEKEGYDVWLVTAQQNGAVPFYELSKKVKLIDLGIDYESNLSQPLLKRIIKKKKLQKIHKAKLAEVLNEIKPDFTISTFTNEASFLPSIKDGSKKILEFHFCRGYKNIQAKVFKYGLLTRLAYYVSTWIDENLIIPKFDQFVVLTEEDRLQWSNKIKRVISIPNAVFETNVFAVLKGKQAISVGRYDAQKGFHRLIEIWGKLHNLHPEWVLNIYGQGSDEQSLQEHICMLGLENSIFLNKPTKQIFEKYKESSLYLMTSVYEGWGLVLSEAMSCGLPCVAYACKCGPKDIIKDGLDGFVVENGSEEVFVSKASLLMSNQEKRISFGESAKKNIKRYSIDCVMKMWLNLFKSL